MLNTIYDILVTMPTPERDIGQFMTAPTASGCEGETDEHNKEHNEDEDGGGADSTSKAKGKERATEGTCSLN